MSKDTAFDRILDIKRVIENNIERSKRKIEQHQEGIETEQHLIEIEYENLEEINRYIEVIRDSGK